VKNQILRVNVVKRLTSLRFVQIHCVSKRVLPNFGDNFVKSSPIFKIVALLESVWNLLQNTYHNATSDWACCYITWVNLKLNFCRQSVDIEKIEKILIKKLYQKWYTAKWLTDEFLQKSWTKRGVNNQLKKLRDTGTVDRGRQWHTSQRLHWRKRWDS